MWDSNHFIRIFHYKPSILGYPHSSKPPHGLSHFLHEKSWQANGIMGLAPSERSTVLQEIFQETLTELPLITELSIINGDLNILPSGK